MHRKPKSGRTPKTTERQQRAPVRLVKADPTKTATDVRKHASDVFGVEICNRTARCQVEDRRKALSVQNTILELNFGGLEQYSA